MAERANFSPVKGFGKIIFGIVLGLVVGGVLFIAWSERVAHTSFMLGVIACVVIVMLLSVFSSRNRSQPNKPMTSRLMLGLFVLLVGLTSGFLLWKQQESSQRQKRFEWKQLQRQGSISAATKSSSLIPLMSNLLNEIRVELDSGNTKSLSEESIARLADLSASLKPYKYLEGDSVSKRSWSPERGQLLVSLIQLDLDSSSWRDLLNKVSFEGADLGDRNLKRVDLAGVDLEGANLANADLRGADLSDANLPSTYAWGADLQSAVLNDANLEAADLSWAELNGADLQHVNAQGANLESAKLRGVNLYNAFMRLANLSGAILTDANLNGVELVDADLTQANLSNANLSGAILKKARMHEAVLSDANLNQVLVKEADWLAKLSEWHVVGAEALQQTYETFADAAGSSSTVNNRIRKKSP